MDQKKPEQQPLQDIRIVPYSAEYKQAFSKLNEQWISLYFTMEPSDYKALDDPEGYIIDKGGYIFLALYNNEPVGVCALIRMQDPEYGFELAKMAVAPHVRGKRIGLILGQAAIDKAREAGARKLYLESNSQLEPAISLYRKLGFIEIKGRVSPYQRVDIQMELNL